MIQRFLPRTEFSDYEDFKQNYRLNVPENYNFGFDTVDAWAAEDSEKLALVWCDDCGEKRSFTFEQISRLSNRAANFFASLGIGKGSVVLLILRRRYEYWIAATALHKLGAVLIPGSLQLTAKDIAYRANAAQICALVAVDDDFVITQAQLALPCAPTLKNLITVGRRREGWLDFNECISQFPDSFPRPVGEAATKATDTMLLYFTSGTTGMPKMVRHDFTYPLGHIVTANTWR